MRHSQLIIAAIVILTAGAAAQAITEAEEQALWPKQDQLRAKQFIEAFGSESADLAELLEALDSFTGEQQRMLVGPVEFGDTQHWPLEGMLRYLLPDADTAKATRLIEFGEAMAQRSAVDLERAHWLAWVSRTRLQTGQSPELARESALQARALGLSLCEGECGTLVEAWLSGSELDAAMGYAADEHFDPRASACDKSLASDGAHSYGARFSDAWLRMVLGRTEDAVGADLQHWWKSASSSCPWLSSYELQTQIDKQFPAILVQQSFAAAQRAAAATQPPDSVTFLGQSLPLPRRECDFSKAADCSITQPLRTQTARILVNQLRGLSASLWPVSMCMRGGGDEDQKARETLVQRFESWIKSLGQRPASDAIDALDRQLLDQQFQSLGDDRASHATIELLTKLALDGESARALSLWQRVLPELDLPQASHKRLMAKLLLYRQRPLEAASILQGIAESYADHDETLAWLQLRAAIEGADLTAAAEGADRPWTVFFRRIGATDYDSSEQITIDDIRVGTMSAGASLDALFQARWVEQLNSSRSQSSAFALALRNAYPGPRWVAEFERALSTVSDDPTPGIVLDGRWLPIPDELCTDEVSCKPPDSDGLRRLLIQSGLMPAGE